ALQQLARYRGGMLLVLIVVPRDGAPFYAWPAHLSLPVRPTHQIQRVRQHDPAPLGLLAQRRVTAIDGPVKDGVLAVLAKRAVSHDGKGHAPDDRVRLRVFDHGALL